MYRANRVYLSDTEQLKKSKILKFFLLICDKKKEDDFEMKKKNKTK